MKQEDAKSASVSDLAITQTADNEVPASASQPQPVSTAFTEIVAEPRPLAAVTSLDDLIGIAAIAEALIKTHAGKTRTERLDEEKALALLQQIAAL